MDLVIRLNDMTLEFDRMAVRQPRYMFHVEEMKYLHNLRLWKRGEAEYRLPTGAHLRVKLRFSPQSKNQKELSGEALIDRSELNLSTNSMTFMFMCRPVQFQRMDLQLGSPYSPR